MTNVEHGCACWDGGCGRSLVVLPPRAPCVAACAIFEGWAMPEPTHQLRTVAWNEVFPWLMLVRALSLATSAPLLLVATVGVLLMPLGWEVAALLLPPDSAPAHDALRRQMPIVTEADVVVWQERVSPHATRSRRGPLRGARSCRRCCRCCPEACSRCDTCSRPTRPGENWGTSQWARSGTSACGGSLARSLCVPR